MRKAIIAALLIGTALPAHAQDRPVIRSEADLPTTRYPFPELPSRTYLDPALLQQLPAMRAEAERLLATSDIQDPSIKAGFRSGLAAIATLQDRPNEARAQLAAMRREAAKPQLQQLGGLFGEIAVATRTGGCPAATARVRDMLAAADPAVIRDEVVLRYGQLQSISPGYHAASLGIGIDQLAREQKSLPLRYAMVVPRIRVEAEQIPVCRTEVTAVLRRWLDDPAHAATDIWPARAVPAAALADARPVVVAVWEAGFDPSIFPGQIAVDPAEPLDGRDNDGNGVVDDAFGPTFDPRLHPTPRTGQPVSEAFAARQGLQLALLKGEHDLEYADDTPEARLFAQRSREASVEEQIADTVVYGEASGWSHATWVASLIADDAPYVRLYNFQSAPYGDDPEPVAMTEDMVDRWEASLPAAAARLRGAGVRVVNMSWGSNADEIADKLMRRGLETDPERARTRAAAMQARVRALLDRTIRACPDILFVASAGNSDQSEAIFAAAPQSLMLPNLLVVGATGTAGRPTAFTTYGDNVRLYALGEGNRVRGPGGMRMRSSGTSFSAPETVRVAAQMLAVAPALTPARLIEGLTGTATTGEGGLRLVHPADAVAWARARR